MRQINQLRSAVPGLFLTLYRNRVSARNHSVDETVERLKGVLRAKGATLFALVDAALAQARSSKRLLLLDFNAAPNR